LVVIDAFGGLAPRQTVQIWFHLDSADVAVDAVACTAETRDANKANLRIAGAPGLALEARPGRVSDLIDVARDSTRLRFSDSGGASERLYVTRLVPRGAAEATWPSLRVETRPGATSKEWPFVSVEGVVITSEWGGVTR
jgi:hypothetical protein